MIDQREGKGRNDLGDVLVVAYIAKTLTDEAPFCATELQISVGNDDDGGGDGRQAASTNPSSRENR